MFVMTHSIWIDGKHIPLVTSVTIKMDVQQLANTATIEIPATAFKKRLKQAGGIKRGQKVSVYLGYDGRNELEFEGFVNRRTDKEGGLEIECEDAMFQFRQTAMRNEELNNPSMKQLLAKVVDAVNDNPETESFIYSSTSLDYKYDKFVFSNASAFDVLKQIQEETKARIYLDTDNVLHIEPQYVEEVSNVVDYSFQRNICKEGLSLTWKDTRDNPLVVEVEGSGRVDGKAAKVLVSAGTPGGDRITEKIRGIVDKNTLQAIAEDMLKARNHVGFEGSFQGWLRPLVTAGDFVNLADFEDESRNGKYYVTSVETSFSNSGGVRTISLGQKV